MFGQVLATNSAIINGDDVREHIHSIIFSIEISRGEDLRSGESDYSSSKEIELITARRSKM